MNPTLGAVVICGGRSRRMGRPKALLPFGSETLLERVARIVGGASDRVVVVAAVGQELPGLGGDVVIVRDPVADEGPLRAMATGFEALGDGVDLAYVTATDAPFITPAWIERLSAMIGAADAAIPDVGGFLHPLAAVYRRTRCLAAANELLREGRSRAVDLAERVDARWVSADGLREVDPDLRALRTLNTPAEYREALRLAGLSSR